jgi:hypothetical protein
VKQKNNEQEEIRKQQNFDVEFKEVTSDWQHIKDVPV